MKVTDWCKNLRFALLAAAGIWIPTAVSAQDIPIGDPSFEAYTVPPGTGYAYAADPNGAYRPTSPWVDDLDSPPDYTQDDGVSSWLYDADYAESTTFTSRPAPRTGNQAMHGLFNYNAQETASVFEANKAYTFSIWAQNDVLLNEANGVFLYVFDGNIPFSDANSLTKRLFTTEIPARQVGMTPAQSKANWTKIEITHGVREGAPEIGHPLGVGFFARKDSAVDDAALRVDPIEKFFMFMEVNTTTGHMTLKNQTGQPVNIDYYEVTSAANALNATGWNSFQDQNAAGFPAGNGTGNGWEQAGGSDAGVISESYLTGNSAVSNSASIAMGTAFNLAGAHDLVFKYGVLAGSSTPVDGDYNGDNRVDAADYTVWRNNLGANVTLPNDTTPGTVTSADYTVWKTNYGQSAAVSGTSTLITGFVKYVTSGVGAGAAVPEPSTVLLFGVGLTLVAGTGRRRP